MYHDLVLGLWRFIYAINFRVFFVSVTFPTTRLKSFGFHQVFAVEFIAKWLYFFFLLFR